MKFGIAIANYDEGADLEATVALARASQPAPHCVVVADDCSPVTFGSSRFGVGADVGVIRSATQRGTAQTKRAAVEECLRRDCDAVAIVDAHMRTPDDWVAQMRAELEAHPKAVCCPSCRGFESGRAFAGSGGRWSERLFYPEPVWIARGTEDSEQCQSVLGACYFMTRETWGAIGGFNLAFYGWGCDEADLSLRAWLTGREVRRVNSMVVQHRFKRNPTSTLHTWHPQYNVMVLCRTLFPAEFNGLYLPRMRAEFSDEAVRRFDDSLCDIVKESARFDEHRSTMATPAVACWRHPAAWDPTLIPQKEGGPKRRIVTTSTERQEPLPAGVFDADAIAIMAGCAGKRTVLWGIDALTPELRRVTSKLLAVDHRADRCRHPDALPCTFVDERAGEAYFSHSLEAQSRTGKVERAVVNGLAKEQCVAGLQAAHRFGMLADDFEVWCVTMPALPQNAYGFSWERISASLSRGRLIP